MRIKVTVSSMRSFASPEDLQREQDEWLAWASPGTEVRVVLAPPKGAETVESNYDSAMGIPWRVEEARKAEEEGFDAVVFPGMCDPGLYAAREISSIPVVSGAETSFLVATALGYKFSVLQPKREMFGLTRQLLRIYGFEGFLASMRVVDLTVEEIFSDKKKAKQALIRVGKEAIEDDGADVLVLGCSYMSDVANEIQDELGVPVIGSGPVALRWAEMLVSLGLSHSKKAYMTPPPKRIEI